MLHSPSLRTTHRYVPTDVGTIHVRQVGSGPTAVLWPSMFVDGNSFNLVVPALALHRTLVIIDGPGFGRSTPLTRRSSIAECARIVIQVLDALGVSEPIDWVGNAWGGHVGFELAIAHSNRIRSLAAIGAPTRATESRWSIRLLMALLAVFGPTGPAVDAVLTAQLTEASRSQPSVRRMVIDAIAMSTTRSLGYAVSSFILDRMDVEEALARSSVRTLIVSTDDREDLSPTDAARVAARMPDGRHVCIGGARVLVPLEQPAALIDVLLEFWSDRES